MTLLVKSGFAASRFETRRNVQQGGVNLDGESVEGAAASYDAGFLVGEGKLLKHGRESFVKFVEA